MKRKEMINMKNIKLNIEGMECHGCENRIKNAISSMKEVKNVIANFETGIVEAECEDTVKEDLIKEKISNLGFTVK